MISSEYASFSVRLVLSMLQKRTYPQRKFGKVLPRHVGQYNELTVQKGEFRCEISHYCVGVGEKPFATLCVVDLLM